MKMKSFWGEYTNPYYNPEKANNGGGYWQHKGGALYTTEDGRAVVIEVEDAGQGDFGSVQGYAITVGGMVYADEWGSNDRMCGHTDPAYDILRAAAGKIGIPVHALVCLIVDADSAANMAARWLWDAHNGEV